MTREKFLQALRAEIEKRFGSLTAYAEQKGMDQSSLFRMLTNQRPRSSLLQIVLADMKIQAYQDLITGEILLDDECEIVE